ncbi:MAG: DNA gyrase subunit B [Arcobacter sp.]|nr:DNA gyrase subunit B [Arcobacter sp.]
MKKSLLHKIYKFILSSATIAYPCGIIFGLDVKYLSYIVLFLGAIWLINFIIAEENSSKTLSLLVSSFFLASFWFKNANISYIYPVLINGFFLFVFSNSLKSTPIITRFVLAKEKRLSLFAKKYTRNLTKIWCLFFVINATISFVLIFPEDKSYWAYYTGFLSYILIGLFFMVEFIVRIILKRRYDD